MAQSLQEERLDDPVTAHLRREVFRIRSDRTVGEAMADLRQTSPEGRIFYFYVIDSEDRLVGVMPVRRFLLSPPEKRVADIMIQKVVTIPHTATVLEACEFFTLHKLLAFPVVDAQRRLLGVIDIDAYTTEVMELGGGLRDDLFQLLGVRLELAKQTSSWDAFRSRFPWLLCNVGGGTLAALLSALYEDVLTWQTALLALFIPVVLSLSESVSIQSVSLALQRLHGPSPGLRGFLAALRREAVVGALLGLGTAGVMTALATIWLWRLPLWSALGAAACLLGGIGGGVTLAAVIGLAMPFALRMVRGDPRVAAGPVALVLADMATLLLYFNLGRWLLLEVGL